VSTLLARVAEDLYWAARYLERAEDTARIIREYTNLLVDLPISVSTAWEPLLAIVGVAPSEDVGELTGEDAIIEHLIDSEDNPSSIAQCVASARENLRSCREVLPVEAWFVVNDLHLYTTSNASDGLARRSRTRFLDRIIAEHQRLIGILAGTMLRDEAYSMTRLGRHVERADMTTRVLDVRAGSLLLDDRPEHVRSYDSLQWASVLRTLAASQMFYRTHRQPLSGPAVVSFALHESRLPRSVAYCLTAARGGIASLPRPESSLAACESALVTLERFDGFVDSASLGGLHESLAMSYFRGSVAPS
jgi:uncharacterized alpha-E superfamily protein